MKRERETDFKSKGGYCKHVPEPQADQSRLSIIRYLGMCLPFCLYILFNALYLCSIRLSIIRYLCVFPSVYTSLLMLSTYLCSIRLSIIIYVPSLLSLHPQ